MARILDTVYWVYFALQLPIYFIDSYPHYASYFDIPFIGAIREDAWLTFHDPFSPPPSLGTSTYPGWYPLFQLANLPYQVLLTLWIIGVGIPKNSRSLPLHYIIYGINAATGTLACMSELLEWNKKGVQTKEQLAKCLWMYGFYFVFPLLMAIDGFFRASKALKVQQVATTKKVQ